MPQTALPTFRCPPVVETVLGFQFEPLPRFTNAHLGLFWKILRDDDMGEEWRVLEDKWTQASDAGLIDESFETFEQQWTRPGLQFKLSPLPSSRLQLRNARGDRMIQLQNGRMHLNWLGHQGNPYPRYSAVRPQFDALIAAFSRFVEREGLGTVRPNQWEITYVNHIPKGTLWQTLPDWGLVFETGKFPLAIGDGVALENVVAKWDFEIMPQRGRLHVELVRARTDPPDAGGAQEVMRMTLTARGPAADVGSLGSGLELGHETIVNNFKRFTSLDAHKYWKIET